MLFSQSFFLYVSNFGRSDCSRTQNVNKRADWLTLFALVIISYFKNCANPIIDFNNVIRHMTSYIL
jgi:hypothetical protein